MDEIEMKDDDGYPTDAALDLIREWQPDRSTEARDWRPWFTLIESAWWNPEWGWKEEGGMVDDALGNRGGTVRRYFVSTGGWSGNEDIIGAMMANRVGWMMTWQESRRGGHFIFDAAEP